MGTRRTRFPVAAKMAFATAGAMQGTGCSPRPVGARSLSTTCVSTDGISGSERIG